MERRERDLHDDRGQAGRGPNPLRRRRRPGRAVLREAEPEEHEVDAQEAHDAGRGRGVEVQEVVVVRAEQPERDEFRRNRLRGVGGVQMVQASKHFEKTMIKFCQNVVNFS